MRGETGPAPGVRAGPFPKWTPASLSVTLQGNRGGRRRGMGARWGSSQGSRSGARPRAQGRAFSPPCCRAGEGRSNGASRIGRNTKGREEEPSAGPTSSAA